MNQLRQFFDRLKKKLAKFKKEKPEIMVIAENIALGDENKKITIKQFSETVLHLR